MKDKGARHLLAMEVAVGAFMVAVMVGLGIFTVVLSSHSLFAEKTPFEAVFKDVMGLREGDNVVVRGMPMGKVSLLALQPDGVHVQALLDTPVAVHTGYVIRVVSTSMLGGRCLQIEQGPESAPVLPGNTLFRGADAYDLMDDAAKIVNSLKHELFEGGIVVNIREATENLRRITERLNTGEGTLGRLLTDDTLYRQLTNGVTALRHVAERLERGEGTLGKLLTEDDLHKDLTATVASLKGVAERLEKGEGTLGKLLSNDDQLYKDVSETVASVKAITAKIERGEGLLGRLVNDDKLYRQVEEILGEVRCAVDDFRETAPITTFTSIFFGAF